MTLELEKRDNHIVLPGRRADITAKSPATYIVLSGKNASIVREAGKKDTLWESEALGVGDTFEVAEGETVTVFNNWGKTPVSFRALRALPKK